MASKPRLVVVSKLVKIVVVVDKNGSHEEKWRTADKAMQMYLNDHFCDHPLSMADGIDEFTLPPHWDESCCPYDPENIFKEFKTIKEILDLENE